MNRKNEIARLAQYGVHLTPSVEYFFGDDLAMDAQTPAITAANSGVPNFLATYFDPKVVEMVTQPNKAAEILLEVKKGSWTDQTLVFQTVEYAGEVSSYGDYSENGTLSLNSTFPQRQPYHYQTIAQWGERQLEMAGQARIDYASRVGQARAAVLAKFQNDSYFYGIQGLQCYGILNDPSLPAAITPTTKVANSGVGPWINAAGATTATALEIFADVQKLFAQLVKQCGGLVDRNAAMKLVMSPMAETALLATNQYNVNVLDLLKKAFPGLSIITAPQYSNGAGGILQLMLESFDGNEIGNVVYTEKLRTHKLVQDMSSWKQKWSQGTAGAIYYYPLAVAQMTGIEG